MTHGPTVQILLIEDDPVWREMLARLLEPEPGMQLVQTAATKEEALSYCAAHQPDVILMDMNLGGEQLDGIQATLELSRLHPATKIIVLTSFDDQEIVLAAFTAGAVQFINKSRFRQLAAIIRESVQANSPQDILMREFWRMKEAELYHRLTAAEKEIVALSEGGAGRAQIMKALGKSEGTLKNQISNILRKFQASSLKEVIRKIKSRGLK